MKCLTLVKPGINKNFYMRKSKTCFRSSMENKVKEGRKN